MPQRKRNTFPTSTLPPELCYEILTRLPTKSILKFRSVSRLWCSLIDDPCFTLAHLKNRQNMQDESCLLVIEPNDTRDYKPICSIRHGETFRRVSKLQLDTEPFSDYQAFGYVNGVLCLKKIVDDTNFVQLLIWNPSIRKALEIPLTEIAKSKGKFDIDYAFGFDPITNDYKIIAYFHIQELGHIRKFVEIYTLNGNSWKSIDVENEPCFWIKNSPKVFLNGLLYWIGNDPHKTISKGLYSHIVSFDVGKEVFDYIDLPDCELVNEREHERFPIILDESIALMDIFPKHTNLWVMRNSSWAITYRIELGLFERCLYIKSDGNLLYTGENKGVYKYNLESQEDKVVAKSYKFSEVFTRPYFESLVLFNGFDDRIVFTFPTND